MKDIFLIKLVIFIKFIGYLRILKKIFNAVFIKYFGHNRVSEIWWFIKKPEMFSLISHFKFKNPFKIKKVIPNLVN